MIDEATDITPSLGVLKVLIQAKLDDLSLAEELLRFLSVLLHVLLLVLVLVLNLFGDDDGANLFILNYNLVFVGLSVGQWLVIEEQQLLLVI